MAPTCGRPRGELGVEVEGVLGPAHCWFEGRLDLLPVQLLQEKTAAVGALAAPHTRARERCRLLDVLARADTQHGARGTRIACCVRIDTQKAEAELEGLGMC